MSIGVYVIRNKINGKIYIGSTTKSFNHRWGNHKLDLRRNSHHSPRLQNAWNKYGEDAFVFSILEECTKEDAISREQYYMDLYRSYTQANGYNISNQAKSRLGINQALGTGKIFYKNIYAFKLTGERVGYYTTTSHAADNLFKDKYKAKYIVKCLKKTKKSYKGYVFSLKDEFPGYNRIFLGGGKWNQASKDKMSKTRTGIKRTDVSLHMTGRTCLNKAVEQWTKEGTYVQTWDSAKVAARALGLYATNIGQACKKSRLSTGNFKWKFKLNQ